VSFLNYKAASDLQGRFAALPMAGTLRFIRPTYYVSINVRVQPGTCHSLHWCTLHPAFC